jgi:DNA relaxase NicK
MAAAKYVFQGADYLRLTAKDHAPYGDWAGLLVPEFLEEERSGRRQHDRWILNYYGRVGEHCFVGRSDAGSMVQVSGSLADTLFRPLSHAGGRCSRVDIQVTATPPEGPDEYLRSAYDNMSIHERSRGRPALLEIRDTNNGAKMVTVGSRTSEIYARIYDKGKESKDKNWQGMVRHELEVKGQAARDLHTWLMDDILRVHTISAIVGNYFKQRGCPMFWEEYEKRSVPDVQRRTKNDATKIAWLATQVAPTFQDLVKKGKTAEALRALLTNATAETILEIRKSLGEIDS